MKKTIVGIGIVLLYCVVSAFIKAAPESGLTYPKDFRSWKNVKTTVDNKPGAANAKYNGFHHIYANELAMSGYRSGKFPDGAIIVFEVLETNTENNITREGKRKFIDVMFKDSKKYAATGGWEYAEFLADNINVDALVVQEKTNCYKCHASQENKDFVFSTYRD
jgi:hypothetical protein